MAGRKQKIKNWCKIIWPVLIIACKVAGFILLLLVVIAVPVAGGGFLLSMDKHHECYREFLIEHYFIRNNYYDGKTWLSVAATLVGAVISATPGLMCGILALWQTHRLHQVEAKYHRPVFEIKKVEAVFVRISRICNEDVSFNSRGRHCVREAERCEFDWWIDLKIDLLSNSGLAIKDMKIDSVVFGFPNTDIEQMYKLILSEDKDDVVEARSFVRDMKDDQTVYTLQWSLCPFIKLKCKDKERLEKGICEFVYYSEGKMLEYSCMELKVNMSLDYEYKEKKKMRCLLKVAFDSEHSKLLAQSKVVTKYESVNGYFTYEV